MTKSMSGWRSSRCSSKRCSLRLRGAKVDVVPPVDAGDAADHGEGAADGPERFDGFCPVGEIGWGREAAVLGYVGLDRGEGFAPLRVEEFGDALAWSTEVA